MKNKHFIDELKNFESENVFNPYSDICEKYDHRNANDIRTQNLERVLDSFSGKKIDAIWLGRDLGHRGGRRTGLALTDESNLKSASDIWQVELKQATRGGIINERTAANIWSYLKDINENIFMWNVFPFHPHENDKPFSNRSHTAKERDIGLGILQELIELLEPNKLVAIGNDAFACALRIFDQNSVYKVRHPSYGGEKLFAEQICKLYEIKNIKCK